MAQTVIRVHEATDVIPQSRRVRDVASRIAYLDPDAAPLTVVLSQAPTSRVAVNSKFEWIEKDLPARWDQINNGAGYSATATSLVVDNGPYHFIGDVIAVVRTGEKMRVTNVVTNTLTVVRAVDGDGVNGIAILDNDDLLTIGNALPEGDAVGVPRSHAETYPFNYTQIVRTPFGTTGTEENSENYTGKDRPRLRMEQAVAHKVDLERTALFGELQNDTSVAGSPRRYTGGLLYFLTQNNQNMGGVMTESEIENWMAGFTNPTGEGDSRLLMASALGITVIDQLAAGRLKTVPSDKTFGIAINQWVTSHGRMNVVKHRLLENGPGGTGFGGYMIAVAVKRLAYRFIANRNTKLLIDRQAPGDDKWTDEYLTECGWQVELPAVHGVATGITG